jgi:hypothetical protein
MNNSLLNGAGIFFAGAGNLLCQVGNFSPVTAIAHSEDLRGPTDRAMVALKMKDCPFNY